MRNVRFYISALNVLLLALGLVGGASADVIHVKADAGGANNGSSWSDAYTTLTVALTAAQAGDEIWVAAGTYKPTSGTDRNQSFIMKQSVELYGGFAGDELTSDTRDWAAHSTILSGDLGVAGNVTDNTYRVVVGARFAVLDGFTVTGGNYSGGGMFNSNCSPTVANCTFSGNTGDGAMYNYNGAAPTVINCTFSGNGGGHTGGGMYNRSTGSPMIINCTFSGNTAGGTAASAGGGGMYNETCSPIVTNCTFSGNSATNGGGGIYNYGATSATVTNCTFSNNSAGYGGGALLNGTGAVTVTNCIFWGDSATTGPEVLTTSGGAATLSHCDIQGSGGSGAQWNTTLGTDGGGNIDADPLFVDATDPAGQDDLWRTGDDGLALQPLSLCINAGQAAGAPAADILGNPRDGAPDLGAYEHQSIPPTAAEGEIAITFQLTKPSTAGGSQIVQYSYHWSSDGGDDVTHGPTTATSDTLTEMNLVQAGETWTVTVTPSSGGLNGPTTTAKVKILDPQAGVAQWILFR